MKVVSIRPIKLNNKKICGDELIEIPASEFKEKHHNKNQYHRLTKKTKLENK